RGEMRAGDAVIEVTDYLKPDLDEIWGILPHRLVAPFARWAERRWPHGRPTLGQHVRTTTVSGYLRVWLLARLRALRPVSWRAHAEHGRIDRWLEAVERALAWDEALACEVAQFARLVKGYGDVRRRLVALFDTGLALALSAGEVEAQPRQRDTRVAPVVHGGDHPGLPGDFLDPIRARDVLPVACLLALLVPPRGGQQDEADQRRDPHDLQRCLDFWPEDSHTLPLGTE